MTGSIFITGASSGLGRATALVFAERGWTVFATMRAGSEQRSRLAGVPGITILPLDVTIPEQIDRAARTALAAGPVDLVFANAGYALGGTVEGIDDAQLVRQIDTNLLGPIRTIKAFLPHVRRQASGGFLVTASPSGYAGMPLLSAYCASKFGLVGWAEGLVYELPQRLFVKIIVPGTMRTNFQNGAEWARHPDHAGFEAQGQRFYTSLADDSADTAPDVVARAVWDAATDGTDQVTYLVTGEARQTVGAREALGADGFRSHLRRQLALHAAL